MAKKMRFPLVFKNGVEIRSIDDLKDNFSIEDILNYYLDGRLSIWLRDRYKEDIADIIDSLDQNDEELVHKICDLFEVEHVDVKIDINELKEEKERLEKLKQYTEDSDILSHIREVVFDDDELFDKLNEGLKTVYLCGDSFNIPLYQEGVTYIGVNNPVVCIPTAFVVDFDELGISFKKTRFDENYQALLDATKKHEYRPLFSSQEINMSFKPSHLIDQSFLWKWNKQFALMDKLLGTSIDNFENEKEKTYIQGHPVYPISFFTIDENGNNNIFFANNYSNDMEAYWDNKKWYSICKEDYFDYKECMKRIIDEEKIQPYKDRQIDKIILGFRIPINSITENYMKTTVDDAIEYLLSTLDIDKDTEVFYYKETWSDEGTTTVCNVRIPSLCTSEESNKGQLQIELIFITEE